MPLTGPDTEPQMSWTVSPPVSSREVLGTIEVEVLDTAALESHKTGKKIV